MTDENVRNLEEGIQRDLREELTYSGYLHLDRLLDAQHPLSEPPHHDELLFIIQHQTSELWFKLLIHELRHAMARMAADDLPPALKSLARVKHIQRQLLDQWSVLATLTPSEYAEFRDSLGASSGFQSAQYRIVEFLLGNKNAQMIEVFGYDPERQAELERVLREPSLYDVFLGHLARIGHAVPAEVLERDVSRAHVFTESLLPMLREIYEHPEKNWEAYETCEELVDIEENFQLWRFRHLKTVSRIIGYKRGTGGSSGVAFLKAALDLSFFPELLAVRTQIGA
ncbi:tryptophan 2,3-dioxygenase [Phaeacidiphilus oryzae]|jgi:tryptophan 2,3-dioxygenase|uniref:tryptophan 2,3-dioxygenase n=1 Tax=Phaeacidiphilus oryzae TaxID=348818 RepID=UPI00056D6CDF|nr:tryptophan 2,3-dioxygenase family protein [Phaeacidiphilus oryzae]